MGCRRRGPTSPERLPPARRGIVGPGRLRGRLDVPVGVECFDELVGERAEAHPGDLLHLGAVLCRHPLIEPGQA